MKLITNLPGKLRVLFGLLRGLTVVLAAFWLLVLIVGAWSQSRLGEGTKLMLTLGEAAVQTVPATVAKPSPSSKPDALVLTGLRGQLQVNLLSREADLVSAARWSVFPAMLAGLVFSWLVFGALRDICANLERGDVFTERNLRLIRNIGVTLIGYCFVDGAMGLWASHVMGGYLSAHASLTSLGEVLHFPAQVGALHFTLPPWSLGYAGTGGLITGCLVLVVSEAFRQGLALKTESDLTV